MTPRIIRCAEVTRLLAEERSRVARAQSGRPEFSLTIAELVEERAKLATAIADEALLAEMGREGEGG